MPKKIEATPIVPTNANEERLAKAGEAAKELNALQIASNDNAKAIAVQVGYEGNLSISSLEDEIRFYQRRTVEAILETGKRLLVLKELTPYGEFKSRVDLLGISSRTAQRFMQAAVKTSKSDILAHLGEQAKNGLAFLELVTHDDDVLENLAEMDDFDRMSASALRVAARGLKAEGDANEKLLTDKNAKIDKLTRENKKGIAALTDWPIAFEPLYEQTDKAYRQIETSFSDISNIIATALAVEIEAGEEISRDLAFQGLANKLNDLIAMSESVLAREKKKFSKTLDSWTPAA